MNAMNLLLVDDDAVLCEALARGLATHGFAVRVAHSVAEAEALADQEAFTHAVIDLRFPGEHGLSLVSALKARNPEARIVVLTGYGSVPAAVEAIKRGATYFLAKPATVGAIVAAFDHQVGVAAPELAQPMSLARFEWEHIQRVLHEHDGNVSAAARALSMHRRTLQRKLAKHPARR